MVSGHIQSYSHHKLCIILNWISLTKILKQDVPNYLTKGVYTSITVKSDNSLHSHDNHIHVSLIYHANMEIEKDICRLDVCFQASQLEQCSMSNLY